MKESGAKHRDKGKGRGGGHYHDDGDNPAELLEKDSGHTAHHREGQEYAEHRKG